MRFFCLLPVRDEGDVIGQTLPRLLAWADSVHVFDNGSIDDTWDIVQDWAKRDKRVVPMRRDPVYFSDTLLRGWIFNEVRRHLRTGDWFLRVDADEIHHVPPPEFVRTRLRPHETVVWHQYYDFCLTASEAKAWDEGHETLADRQRPIEERRRWYIPSVYAEPRMCRYRESMRWPVTASFPYNAGFLARARLPIRHYPHRDPAQLERRVRLRAFMTRKTAWVVDGHHHWNADNIRQFITADDHPQLRHWLPGTALPEVEWTNHLPGLPTRAAQRLLHALAVPVLDRLRPGWTDGAYPGRIPEEIVRRMERELAPSPPSALPACT